MMRRATYHCLLALALAACGSDAPRPAPKKVSPRAQSLVMAPGWVAGSGWPAATIVSLNSFQLQQGALVLGDAVNITASAGPWLANDSEAVIGTGAELRGNLKADSVYIRDGGHVTGTAAYNQITNKGRIDGAVTSTLALPLAITVPAVSSFSAGTTVVDVAAGATQTIAAGSYGAVTLRASTNGATTTLKLSGGVYNVASIDMGDSTRLECTAACEIRVKGRLLPGARSYIGPVGASGLLMSAVQIFVEGTNNGSSPVATPFAAEIGGDASLDAFVFVPNGTLHLRTGSSSVGKFVAKDVQIGSDADVQDGTNVTALPDPWVTGPAWPAEAITALNSVDLSSATQITGDVSVIAAATGATLATGLELNIGSDVLVTGNVRADTVMLRSGARVTGAISHNGLTNNGLPPGSAITPLALPLDLSVPAFPSFAAGSTTVDLTAGVKQNLAAGSYGLVRLRAGTNNNKTVLTLTGGVYNAADLDLADNSRVECSAPCEVRVKNRLAPGTGTYIGPTTNGPDLAEVKLFVEGKNGGNGAPGVTPYAAVIGQSSEIRGLIFVPNGTLHLRTSVIARGRFVAHDVLTAGSANVQKGGATIAPPVIFTQPQNVTVAEGQSATFSVIATGQDVTFQWQKNGVDIAGETTSTYTLANATAADNGNSYRVIVTNPGGTVTSAAAILTVTSNAVTITTQPQSATVTEGDSVSFTCAASGSGTITYQWRKSGTVVPSATTPTFSIANVTPDDAASYSCVASNGSSSATSNPAVLTVNLRAPVITTQPASTSVAQGQGFTLTCGVTGTSLSYSWKKDGAAIAGATSATYQISSAQLSDAGSYVCIATNSGGTVTSSAAVVTIVPPAPLITTQPADVTVTMGQPFELSVTATGAQLSYQWQRFGADIPGAIAGVYHKNQAEASDEGAIYRVVVSNPGGSVTSRDATVHLGDADPPTVVVNNPATSTQTATFITVTGTATDAFSGVSSVVIVSDRFGTQQFGTVLDAAGAFSGEVPLALGANALTVIARDGRDNAAQQLLTVTVTAPQLPQITITSPANGSTVTTSTVTVGGTVRSTLPASALKISLGSDVQYPTGAGPDYTFSFPGVRLLPGSNQLTVVVESTLGTVTKDVQVTFGGAPAPPSDVSPSIALQITQPDVYIVGDVIPVSGTVTAACNVQSVTVNGTAAHVVGSGSAVSFDAALSFAAQGSSDVTVTIVARDCHDLSTTRSYVAHQDDGAPLLTVTGVADSPAITSVLQTPYRLTGTISERNLAGLTVASQSVGALPAGTAGQWTFSVDIPLSRQIATPISVEAWDLAGLHTTRDVILRLDSSFQLELLSPREGARIGVEGETTALEVTARAIGMNSGDRMFASFDGAPQVELPRAGDTAHSTLTVAAAVGPHVLRVTVVDAGGTTIASAAATVELFDLESVPLAVVEQTPANEQTGIEANSPITLTFNKPIDPAKVTLSVLETVHGKLFVGPPDGADLMSLSEVSIEDVHREREPVPGDAQNLPGNQMIVFYPSRDYGYGGTVFLDVAYDGAPLHHARFEIRPLPALLHGFVADEQWVPIEGVNVLLPDVGAVATTNKDGNFSFNFGVSPDKVIAPGRYRAIINPGNARGGFGSLERFLTFDPGLSYAGVNAIAILSTAEPYRHVKSRQTTPAVLAGGQLQLDVSGADLTFPDARDEGDVHVQFLSRQAISYTAPNSAIPEWVFVTQPIAVGVAGTVGVRIMLPKQGDSFAYIEHMPDLVTIVGLDPASLQLLPIGVGRIDRTTHELVSQGVLALDRLDVIGISTRVGLQPALFDYSTGKITLSTLRAALEAQLE